MNKQRFVVSDALWQRLTPHLPGKVSDAGVTAKTIACFSKQPSGGYVPCRRGATWHLPFAIETANSGDLPLNFHPFGIGARWVDTPIGAGGATDIRAELSDGAARVSVAVVRCSANSFGV